MSWYLVEITHANWPGLPRYRGADSKRGYPTKEAAFKRRRQLLAWAAAEYGQQGGPGFTVVEKKPSKLASLPGWLMDRFATGDSA